jgi:hypothetical protein
MRPEHCCASRRNAAARGDVTRHDAPYDCDRGAVDAVRHARMRRDS